MCGINGFISDQFEAKEREAIVGKMNARMAHRGPDHDGVWSQHNVTFGHRRLSIIDLSPESNQPFFSADKRYCIVYNGELYNYRELKLELQRSSYGSGNAPIFFHTASDTEVVLAAYMRWGEKCLEKFNGMFAFAIYDCELKRLFAARDPLGVKPFYYSYSDEGFLFSSEVRSILISGIRKFSLNRSVLAEYTMYQTVYAPQTIVKEIKVLMPGHYLELNQGKAAIACYFDLNKIEQGPELTYQEACRQVRELLAASVQRRMVSDVPFGAFLSGGIDSSAVVALMTQVSQQKVKTFNISFDESAFSEAQYARLISKKYDTEHHEIKLSPVDFLEQLPEALDAMDHPGGDGANTYIVSKATRKAGVTMALSGIGGDELFAGYDVFKRLSEIGNRKTLTALPLILRRTGAAILERRKKDMAGKKMGELLSLPVIDFNNSYPLTRSLYTSKFLTNIIDGDASFQLRDMLKKIPQYENQLLSAISVAEMNSYMQNVLLRDTDQMGMSVALEIREPFLDKHLVSFVLSLKDEYKYPTSPKKLLVDSLGDLLPTEIVNRPKMGFTLPWQVWLKKDLKSFCQKNITELEGRNLMKAGAVMGLWERFLNDDPLVSWSRVWHLVILNDWLAKNGVE